MRVCLCVFFFPQSVSISICYILPGVQPQ
jgi:hypothetical protein